ncbi:hypothetical protein ACNAW0_16715 [Micromonospora sp. SL1-18]
MRVLGGVRQCFIRRSVRHPMLVQMIVVVVRDDGSSITLRDERSKWL